MVQCGCWSRPAAVLEQASGCPGAASVCCRAGSSVEVACLSCRVSGAVPGGVGEVIGVSLWSL